MNIWIKNSNGKKDSMLTFATISFFVVTLSIFLSSISEVTFGEFSITFLPLDAGLASIYIGATFTAYVTRKYTDKKFDKETGSGADASLIEDVADKIVGEKDDKRRTRTTKPKQN